MSARPQSRIYVFGDFRLDVRRRLLSARDDGRVVPLTTKALDTLVCLVEHAGEVVTKAELLREVWPHVMVEENSVSQCVSALRRALGEDPSEHRFIVTVPGRGYRFIAEVTTANSDGDPPVLSLPTSGRRNGDPTDRRHHSLAVLPFKPLSAAHAHDSLELGMTDALIMRIGRLANMHVSPLSSVRRYATLEQDPLEAGRALGAERVLDGCLQRHGDRLRVSVRLLDVETGRQLWADRFDEDFTDIFGIQDAIAERVASAALERLTGSERERLRRHPTDNPHAYQLYATGWSALTRPGGANLEHALHHLEQAVALDPAFALAQVCVADCYALLAVFGLRAPHDVFPKARAAVAKALEIDPDLAEAHAELGHIYGAYDLDWRRSEVACRRALEINPRSSMAHHYLGLAQIASGHLDEALASIRRAQALEPLAANFNANIGMIHYYAGRYHEAIAQLAATLEIDRDFDHARSFLGRAHMRLGAFERAIEEFQQRTSITIGDAADLPCAYALSGRRDDARNELSRLVAERDRQYVSPHSIAMIHAALGDTQQALGWLERALDERTAPIGFLAIDPAFAALRAEPRFEQMLRRIAPK